MMEFEIPEEVMRSWKTGMRVKSIEIHNPDTGESKSFDYDDNGVLVGGGSGCWYGYSGWMKLGGSDVQET